MSNITYYSKLSYKCAKLSVEHGYNMVPVSFEGCFYWLSCFFPLDRLATFKGISNYADNYEVMF